MNPTINSASALIDDFIEDINELCAHLADRDWAELDHGLAAVHALEADPTHVDETTLTEAASQVIAAFEAIPALAKRFADILSQAPARGERRLPVDPKREPPSQDYIERLKNKMLKASDLARQEAQKAAAGQKDKPRAR